MTHALADEISPAMARDVFDEANEWKPRPEIVEAQFDLVPDVQVMEVKEHPELDPIVRVPGVTLRKIGVFRAEGGLVMLGFTATWTIGDYEREAAAMIRRLKTGIYLSMEVQEPRLKNQQQPELSELPESEAGMLDGPEPARQISRRGRKKVTKFQAPDKTVN